MTEHVDKIWDEDPEFVVFTYATVFADQELRDEITNPMGGRTLPPSSTHRQDYSMCHYWLAQHVPNFLRAEPIAATQAVIQSLNFYIIRTQIVSYRREAIELEDRIEPFEFGGRTTHFLRDNSYTWDKQEIPDEPIEMADALFEYISELVKSEESLFY